MNTQHFSAPRRAAAAILICLYILTPAARADEPAPPLMSVNLLDIAPSSGDQPVARNTSVRFRGFGIYSNASGSMNVGNSITGVRNNIDFESTLGMDLDKFTGGALLGFNLGAEKRLHVDLSYDGYYDYKGTANVGSIAYNGNVYTANVSSSIQLLEGALVLGYDIWRSDSTGLTVTPTLGARMFFINSKLAEVSSDLRDSSELWFPFPELGIAVRWDVTPNIYVRGSAEGIWLGELATYGNFTAEVGYDLNANVGVFVGYRYWLFRIDYSDDNYDFDTGSVYAGIEFRL